MFNIELQFYKTTEKMPEKSGTYLCVTKSGFVDSLMYSTKYGKFNTCDDNTAEQAEVYAIDCEYWADMTELKNKVTNEGE